MIAKILSARVTTYRDNGQTLAWIEWEDGRGKTGTTQGTPNGLYMKSLLQRAEREGVNVKRGDF